LEYWFKLSPIKAFFMENNTIFESLEDFYNRKFEWIPENLSKDIGHVNVFRLPHPANKPVPYRRRDFYKVTLCRGASRLHYADKVFSFEKQAMFFLIHLFLTNGSISKMKFWVFM